MLIELRRRNDLYYIRKEILYEIPVSDKGNLLKAY